MSDNLVTNLVRIKQKHRNSFSPRSIILTLFLVADLDSKLIESDPKSFLKQADSKIGFGTGTKKISIRLSTGKRNCGFTNLHYVSSNLYDFEHFDFVGRGII